MSGNLVLQTIKERKMCFSYQDEPIGDEVLQQVLNPGRWAQSFGNSQPWKFIVVEEEDTKTDLYKIAREATIYRTGLKSAPVVIAVAVDQTQDTSHFIEEGAVAAQTWLWLPIV